MNMHELRTPPVLRPAIIAYLSKQLLMTAQESRTNSMKSRRIHVMGASGVGVTTLGRAIADAVAIPHHDADDYFWLPTTPPYRERREIADRLRLMREIFLGRSNWVLSGSIEGWSASIAPLFDLVVFVEAPVEIRLS